MLPMFGNTPQLPFGIGARCRPSTPADGGGKFPPHSCSAKIRTLETTRQEADVTTHRRARRLLARRWSNPVHTTQLF